MITKEYLLECFNGDKKTLNFHLSKVNQEIEVSLILRYSNLGSNLFTLAIAEVGFNNDFSKSRKLFQMASLSFLNFLSEGEKHEYQTGLQIEFIFSAILSDNVDIQEKIRDINLVNFGDYDNSPISCLFRCFQCVLNQDLEKFKEFEEKLKISFKRRKNIWKDYLIFFETLFEKDTVACEKILNKMLILPQERHYDTLYKESFSAEVTSLVKIAKIYGMDININNPRVPKEMVEICLMSSHSTLEEAVNFYPDASLWSPKILGSSVTEEKKGWFGKIIEKFT
jgi:hypothetical protein